jgi:hypothetical protein
MSTTTHDPQRATTDAFMRLMPGVETHGIEARRFAELIEPLEGLNYPQSAATDAVAVRAQRDTKIASFPERFQSVTGVSPSSEQEREHAERVENELDTLAQQTTRSFWTAWTATEKQLDQLEGQHRELLSDPDACEAAGIRVDPHQARMAWALGVAAERERLKGMTYRAVEKAYTDTDDERGRALRYLLERAAAEQTFDKLGIVGEPADRLILNRAIEAQKAARVPKWIQAARARHRELLPPIKESLVRMILSGQRIAAKSPTTRQVPGAR